MHADRKTSQQLPVQQVVDLLGLSLIEKLHDISFVLAGEVYLTGGTVRDLLIGREPLDIDLTVTRHAKKWASKLVELTGGTYVQLGRDEDAARVVWQERDIDFSSFRDGAETIEEELTKRDITINSMAVSLDRLIRDREPYTKSDNLEIIDPTDGIVDLAGNIIRATTKHSFSSDPLRMLRVFRFAATLGFQVDQATFDQVVCQRELISRSAVERVSYEFDLIMQSSRAHREVCNLARSGLLFTIIPELEAGKGMEQPASHHLDVFEHSLSALECMERVQREPAVYFPEFSEVMVEYVAKGRNALQLRWAALLHDLGKPSTLTIDEDRGGKITFYNHDRTGAELVKSIARRLKWSQSVTHTVCRLVELHMRPFFLCNVQRKEELSLKACLRLVRLVGSDLPGLFLLSMADALAGKGKDRPEKVEKEVASLFSRMIEVLREHVEPVHAGPPLLTGEDLIKELHLEPGPLFKKILNDVEEAHMEKQITTREQALDFVRTLVKAKEAL